MCDETSFHQSGNCSGHCTLWHSQFISYLSCGETFLYDRCFSFLKELGLLSLGFLSSIDCSDSSFTGLSADCGDDPTRFSRPGRVHAGESGQRRAYVHHVQVPLYGPQARPGACTQGIQPEFREWQPRWGQDLQAEQRQCGDAGGVVPAENQP